jgi:hypothetical protein
MVMAPPLFGELDAEPTLDDVLVRAWDGLGERREVECPVCHGEMAPEYGAQALPVGGRCSSCGAALR